MTTPVLILASEHVQILGDEAQKGQYYYYSPLVADGRQWIAIDKTGPSLRSGQFATQQEAEAFFNSTPTTGVAVSEPLEAAGGVFTPEGDLSPLPAPHETVDGVSRVHNDRVEEAARLALAKEPDPPPPMETNGAPEGFVRCNSCSLDFDIASTPDFNHDRLLCSRCVDIIDFPFAGLTDEELTDTIRAAEKAWFEPFRNYTEAESKLTALQAKFDDENADLIAQKKISKELKEARAKTLKTAAAEYFRRHPEEKKFDVYVGAKEFQHVEIDEPLAIEWAQANFPAAVQTERITLDYRRIENYVKDLVRRKEPVPNFAKFKYVTEVQLSTKVPPPDEA